MDQQTVKLLTYTGNKKDFSIWSARFVAMMLTKGLYKSLLGTEGPLNEPASLANGASNDEKKNHKVLKDAYEKEVADIKEKQKNVGCHLALTLDATTLMRMRHKWVGDDGIRDGAKAWKLLQERFQCVDTPTVVTSVAQLARPQVEDAEDLDSFTEQRKGLQNLHESKTQRHKGQSGSVALAVKRDFKKGPQKGNFFVCGIPGQFAKDCRRKETTQCIKLGYARDREIEAKLNQ